MNKIAFLDRVNSIKKIDIRKLNELQNRFDKIAKPLKGLGKLEDLICKIGAVNGLDITKRCVVVACADNGIVEEKITQTSSNVTAIVAKNILSGDATVCKLSQIANVDVVPIDVGMNSEVENLRTEKTMHGTNNFAKTEAMTETDAISAIVTGMNLVKELKNKGYKLIAVGEMGIGNTTTSSAICAVLTGVTVENVTSKGAGLSNEGVKHKIQVIKNAIIRMNPNKNDPIDVICKVGGLDIACMCGVFLGGAENSVPLIIDGFISSVACLLAVRLNEFVIDYVIASHMSNEGGAKTVLNALGLSPIIHAEMALGEGTGAVAIIPMLDMAMKVLLEMVTFEATNIEEYKKL